MDQSDRPGKRPGRKKSSSKKIREATYLEPDLQAWAEAARGDQPMSEFIRDCVHLRRQAVELTPGKSRH